MKFDKIKIEDNRAEERQFDFSDFENFSFQNYSMGEDKVGVLVPNKEASINRENEYERIWNKIKDIYRKTTGKSSGNIQSFHDIIKNIDLKNLADSKKKNNLLSEILSDHEIHSWLFDNDHCSYLIEEREDSYGKHSVCVPMYEYDKYGFDKFFLSPSGYLESLKNKENIKEDFFNFIEKFQKTRKMFLNVNYEDTSEVFLGNETTLTQDKYERNGRNILYNRDNSIVWNKRDGLKKSMKEKYKQKMQKESNDRSMDYAVTDMQGFISDIQDIIKQIKGKGSICTTISLTPPNSDPGHQVAFCLDIKDGKINKLINLNSNTLDYKEGLMEYSFPVLHFFDKNKMLSGKLSSVLKKVKNKVKKNPGKNLDTVLGDNLLKKISSYVPEPIPSLKLQEQDDKCIRHSIFNSNVFFQLINENNGVIPEMIESKMSNTKNILIVNGKSSKFVLNDESYKLFNENFLPPDESRTLGKEEMSLLHVAKINKSDIFGARIADALSAVQYGFNPDDGILSKSGDKAIDASLKFAKKKMVEFCKYINQNSNATEDDISIKWKNTNGGIKLKVSFKNLPSREKAFFSYLMNAVVTDSVKQSASKNINPALSFVLSVSKNLTEDPSFYENQNSCFSL